MWAVPQATLIFESNLKEFERLKNLEVSPSLKDGMDVSFSFFHGTLKIALAKDFCPDGLTKCSLCVTEQINSYCLPSV